MHTEAIFSKKNHFKTKSSQFIVLNIVFLKKVNKKKAIPGSVKKINYLQRTLVDNIPNNNNILYLFIHLCGLYPKITCK